MAKKNKRFPVGALNAILKKKRGIASRLSDEENELLSKSKKVNTLQRELNRLKKKEAELPQEIEDQKEKVRCLLEELRRHGGGQKKISNRKDKRRKQNPTLLKSDNFEEVGGNLTERSGRTRRGETLEACRKIHGASEESDKPAVDGLWLTFIGGVNQDELKQYIQNSDRIKKILPSVVNKDIYKYEKEEDNYLRSLSLLYTGGILSKEKYKCIRNSLAFEQGTKSKRKRIRLTNGTVTPAVVTYDKLIKFVNNIDIGMIRDFSEVYDNNEEEEDSNFGGAYREIGELLVILAKFYFFLSDVMGSVDLFWFDESNTFHVALGADGAPFGKHDEATSWLVSIMNTGKHIASSYNNFLLCGANCTESHPGMVRYCKKLIRDIAYVETSSFKVNDKHVRFKFSLIPGDMKWVASFAGELTNSAYYFSSFADVCQADKTKVNGSLGTTNDCTWKPWEFEERIENAKKVAKFKETPRQGKLPTRTKTLDYMKKNLKCRQEFEPLLGRLIDKAYAEPLHNSNNAWQQFNLMLIKDAIERSELGKNGKYKDIPPDCIFKKYMTVLRNVVRANRVFKKVRKWFNEGRTNEFSYRFTGKDTKLFCHKFMYLVKALDFEGQTPCQKMFVYVYAYVGVQLRDATSLFSRVSPPPNYLSSLKESCRNYFNSVCLFFSCRVTPTVWTIGYAIPYHAKIVFDKFAFGLGINTMQGREAKHTMISKFASHSTPGLRWRLIFRHEFISTIWLRSKDPRAIRFTHQQVNYLPQFVASDDYCYCGLPKKPDIEKCGICSDAMYDMVASSVKGCSLVPGSWFGQLTEYN